MRRVVFVSIVLLGGLDSSTAKQISCLLHLLAKQGRTVVTSLHQPSNQLLSLVDRLYGISSGKCTYNGSVRLLRPFLEQFELVCPITHDPVDFFIEISAPVSENQRSSVDNSIRLEYNHERLVLGTENGKSIRWVENSSFDIDNKVIDNLFKNNNTERICITSLPAPKEDPTSKILLALKSTYPTPFWKQFAVLTRREYLLLWRDTPRTLMITGIHAMMALFVGTLFYDIGVDAKDAMNNLSLLFFCLMFIMFTAFSSVSVTFPEQVSIIRREHFNRWYTAGACYSATVFSSLPIQTLCSLVFALITYYLAGHPHEWYRLTLYCCTLLLVSYVAMFVGLLNGCIFNVKNGIIFGPFFIMPFVIFAGFFLQLPDAPPFLRWLFHLSFLKYGFSGMVISIFGDRSKLPCTSNEFLCYYTYPKQLLKDRGMESDTYMEVVLALGIIGFVFITCAYIVLKIRLKSRW